MATKLIHLHNSTAGKVPLPSELVAGQIAINTADKKIFILAADGTVASIAGGGGAGSVTSVNGVAPDGGGNVALTTFNLGASTLGNSVFTAATAAAARTVLGATTVGSAVFTAATAAAAQSAIGATSVGSAVLSATDAPTAVSALGASSVGAAVFTANNTATAQSALGATAIGKSIFTAADAPTVVSLLQVVPSSSVGAANGVAPLDVNGKVPTANLPASILGSVNYQGTFTPGSSTLPIAGVGNKGWYYVTTSGGTYTPPGGTLLTFSQGDWLISDASKWSVLDSQDAVTAVNGKTGAVTLVAGDITSGIFGAAQLGANPATAVKVLTTDSGGNPTWLSVAPASILGAGPGNTKVLVTDTSGNPTWVTAIPYANLPVATASSLGLAQAGSGLSVVSGILSVNTSALTLDEGTYVGA